MSKEPKSLVIDRRPTDRMHGHHILVPRDIPLKDLERGSRSYVQENVHERWQLTFVPHFDWSVDAPTTAYFL